MRSTPECDSQDLAEETRRLATSAPRFCASMSDDVARPFVPRKSDGAGREIGGARQVEERWQQRLGAYFGRVD